MTNTRAAIVEAVTRLLRETGAAGVTTRAVSAAAGVQAPTIYRLFGDKDGLLDAVAEQVMATYVAEKSVQDESDDPVADLRDGWQVHVDFGLANPDLFALLVTPGRSSDSRAVEAGAQVLRRRVQRLAEAGLLRVDQQRAVDMIHAAGTGAVLALLASPPERRDLGLADHLFDAVTAAILTDAPAVPSAGPLAVTVAFSTTVPELPALTAAERTLLAEWLERSITELGDR
ncbi:AcrR family transcriptional regulator [Actinoplanes octamycinicus]|uniref:AcrR family transcriptional regulator n=1 Tax=Actinoplanes octamycinicus TaxID=135948 RepID=A0A7W7H0K4_9ACTN|nr:TetR/AcrR family transcriptional regulator [Actinoplanes octamycinicus]MBB4741687.1 AcrR family transcriptional regulator [Actinoplanes octamycinicus]GIE57240.1 TetR family transcriptional regulator [Actinoplanes octamycinicus]